jgi:glycerate kinase
MLALASPASLKGVLPAREAAAALAEGLRAGGAEASELPVADGGEGTAEVLGARVRARVPVHDAFGRPREARVWELDDAVVVESAEVLPLDPTRLDVFAASSRGLGDLIGNLPPSPLLVICLGGTATMDGGAELGLERLSSPTICLADVRARLLEAPRLFGPQKGATAEQVLVLEHRLAELERLRPYASLPGSGAAGGLGAAFAALGAELLPGAPYVLERIGFFDRLQHAALVVTGEGTVDATTTLGKAAGEVARVCREGAKRCVVFGGRVEEAIPGAETIELSGNPTRAADDLRELGERLALS